MSKADTFHSVGGKFSLPGDKLVSCGDVSCEFLVDPIPRPTPPPIKALYKPEKREVLLIDSGKPNSITVMETVQRRLRELGIPVQDEIWTKINASQPMPHHQMEAAAQQKGLVVGGIND